MKVIGYGICGAGEAGRYMRETLEEFKRLCDEVVILVNAPAVPTDKGGDLSAEIRLIKEFGFRYVEDRREWGKYQWKIKQDLLDGPIRSIASVGDVMIGLDMDERFDRSLTREWLLQMPFDAYHTFVVDLWNDEKHYKPESCFWKVQIWRWSGNVEWTAKPLHCGLVPRWAASYNRYAPFLQIHKGLMRKEDRARKIARYEKYDPHAQYLAKPYYAMIRSDTAEPFDEEQVRATIAREVSTYKQTKPRSIPPMSQPKGRFAYVTNPAGVQVDIPERMLDETLKRKGFTFVGWADEATKEIEEMFAEDNAPAREGSYQRGAAEEKKEVDALNARDDEALSPDLSTAPEAPTVRTKSRVGMKENAQIKKPAKKKK